MIHKGEILRKLIRERKSTVSKVAEHLGINRSYLSTLLNDANLRDQIVDKACNFLEVDKEQYFTENPPPPSGSYMEKYIQLMERFTEIQTENIELVKEVSRLKLLVETYQNRHGKLE